MFGLFGTATDSLLCRIPVVVAKRATKTLSAFHFTLAAADFVSRIDDRVVEALMIAFAMVMNEEGSYGSTQRGLTEEDDPVQGFLFDASHKSLEMSVQIGTLWRQSHSVHTLALQDVSESRTKLVITVHDQVLLAIQEAVFEVGQFAAHLLHPGFVGIDATAREVDASCFQFHDEQQVECNQSAFRPNLDCCEIDGSEHVPMSCQEGLPLRLPFAFGNRH